MILRFFSIVSLSLATLTAADSSPEDLLRQGLFEEEANRDFDKASENYRAVIAAHDDQRAFAATATYRLGEIARKKNDNEAAAAAFRAVAERFPEQENLARLSRENLTALGMVPVEETPTAPPSNNPEDVEIAKLKEIARNSPDLVDGAGTDGWRPLHHAVAKGFTRVVSYLLQNQADPNSRTINEELTPLHLASIYGNLHSVNTLLAAKADVNATFAIQRCPKGILPVADQKAKFSEGDWTALDLAILYDRREVARALMEAGTDLNHAGPMVQYAEGLTPLVLAICLKRNDLAQALIDAGSPLDGSENGRSVTPLGSAVQDNQDMLVPLLKAGADPNRPYFQNGTTPLHTAVQTNRIEIAKLLIEAGSEVNATDAERETPLHGVLVPELIDLLVSKGAEINSKNSSGFTPLEGFTVKHFTGANKEVIEAFLKRGATVADPIALLRRCSEPNLSAVRELIVYPREMRGEAILLSVSGQHPFNVPPDGAPTKRPPAGSGPSESYPNLITLESRLTENSPPPSVAEAMNEAFGFRRARFLTSIRIMRHAKDDVFQAVQEWKLSDNAALPKEWPALQWGDIVEVHVTNGYSGSKEPPDVRDLGTTIPDRTVTFRLGDLEIPKAISGEMPFWLSMESIEVLFPNIQILIDETCVAIQRKGVAEPVPVDLTKLDSHVLRLIDGDVIRLSFDLRGLEQRFYDETVYHLVRLIEGGLIGVDHGQLGLISTLASESPNAPIDYQKILILRRAEKWKSELINVKAWLESLPPSEQWDGQKMLSTAPKIDLGDIVILSPDQNLDSGKDSLEIRAKLNMLRHIVQSRLRVIPPPLPSR